MAKVKICGLTNKEDAIWALNYGADYLGINFYPKSPRHVALDGAPWIHELPSFASLVGVFVDAKQEDILHAVKKNSLKGIQLHGNESVDDIKTLKFSFEGLSKKLFIIKAFRIQDETSLEAIPAYLDVVDYLLLDGFVEDQSGGTGHTFNWDLALKAKDWNKPFFLAGGLNPDNVKDAVKKVQPFALDVASGVEKSPRKKDTEKIKNFIGNAK